MAIFFVKTLSASTQSGSNAIKGMRVTRYEYSRFCIMKSQHKMDATQSFGVTKISEKPSNPQLTLVKSNVIPILLNFDTFYQ